MENNENVVEENKKYNKLAIISFVSSSVSFLILAIVTLDSLDLFFRELPIARLLSFVSYYLGGFSLNLVPLCFIVGGAGGIIVVNEIKHSKKKGKGIAISAIFLAILSIFMLLRFLISIFFRFQP